jgi:ataxia telangiectasia mutated family protein
MVAEHPYHTLYHVHALSRGDQVGGSGTHHYSMPREKIVAANEVLARYKQGSPAAAKMVVQMDRMIEAYIVLAKHDVEAGGGGGAGGFQIPGKCKKRNLSNLNMVPVITAALPVDPTMTYKEGTFPSFSFFGDTCRLVGGVNHPKLVEAHASDGQMYRQLAKAGNDDLRQDAVMQQLFGVVNRLLADDPATRARRLRVGTYRVVPFTPAAGVLEWVDNTTLLSEYLLGSGVLKGAHERYRPGDWKSRECREKLTNCKTRPEQRATYTKVEAHFKPVMHHFFLENFPTPHMWYQRRLAYTRSVAVNSVVGYIIGLGDRHSSNILMDQSSAEMIHIDLGVAFEQGKCLKTPEQVPFRMTRDIVDGMGATGVEGVMRRCCEESLRVLRANKDALTTIVAVLIHDPILKWAVSPERANQRQRDDGDGGGNKGASGDVAAHNGGAQPGAGAAPQEGNLDAERALMRVGQKLDGYEGSELRSVEGQVQQLLQDAQDPEKLCVMYPGWAAWV